MQRPPEGLSPYKHKMMLEFTFPAYQKDTRLRTARGLGTAAYFYLISLRCDCGDGVVVFCYCGVIQHGQKQKDTAEERRKNKRRRIHVEEREEWGGQQIQRGAHGPANTGGMHPVQYQEGPCRTGIFVSCLSIRNRDKGRTKKGREGERERS